MHGKYLLIGVQKRGKRTVSVPGATNAARSFTISLIVTELNFNIKFIIHPIILN